MSVGAQPSESVVQVFRSVGIMDRFARYKAGEPIEKLLEESKVYFENRKVEESTLASSTK
ncbi:MAG: hypothetical protein HY835_06420 [Anaerolineae bacterium]|nr:hypothetical protein [Anaerolineae bacterium]